MINANQESEFYSLWTAYNQVQVQAYDNRPIILAILLVTIAIAIYVACMH